MKQIKTEQEITMQEYHGYWWQAIREEIARQGHIGVDPRHVEAYMRLEHGCLDGLSKRQFQDEVRICIACVLQGGSDQAEMNAKSFGL